MKRKIFGYVFAFMAMLLWASLSDRVSFAADESKEGAPAAEAPKAEAPSAALLHRRRQRRRRNYRRISQRRVRIRKRPHLGPIRRALPLVCGQLQPVTGRVMFLISCRCKISMIGWRTTYILLITFGLWSPVF